MEKLYEAPTITTLGTLRELTEQDLPAKCGGSGDSFEPLEDTLSNEISTSCP